MIIQGYELDFDSQLVKNLSAFPHTGRRNKVLRLAIESSVLNSASVQTAKCRNTGFSVLLYAGYSVKTKNARF